MVSFWKTQWFNLVAGTFAFCMFVFNLIRGEGISACLWLSSAYVWFVMARVEYDHDRIQLLEKKQERDDAMYSLVQELVNANKIDREHIKKLEARINVLEGTKK